MKTNYHFLFSVATIILFFISGCTGHKDGSVKTSSTAEKNDLIEVKDSSGSVKVPKDPTKVVVFDNGMLDILDELGLQDRIVGVPVAEDIPQYLTKYIKTEAAGGVKEPNLEKINQLQPDLIIISGRQADFKKELSKIAPTLYLEPDYRDYWTSVKRNIQTIGIIFDKQQEAKQKINIIDDKLVDLKAKVTKENNTALVTLVNEGSLSVYGSQSRYGFIHDVIGFKQADDQIKPSSHGQEVSYEYVLDKNPDIIFVVDRTKAIGGDTSKNNVSENELVKQTKAGKNKKVITLQPDVWYLSGGGLKSSELMLNDLAQGLE
ncbi:siderophore ABC transporter substrate-binding protein [Enterococcus faecalis]|uniref:siderophore ABC transporter substrate-binding protein n=1 Tax=Enterococcus TaxID=1350 RepID=UPI003CC78F04